MSNHIAGFRKVPRLFSLVTSMLVLLIALGNAFGTVFSPLVLQADIPIASPPAFLQTGTAGNSTIFANNTSAKVSTVAPRNWLNGWEKRVKITINKNNITSALSSFPVLVHLSSSSGIYDDDVRFVFNELLNDANRKKIAITTGDGTTQCYIEIEKWDTASKQAWLWTRVPSLSNTEDTILYLYYDRNQADNTNYAGDTGSTAARNVWDSSFKGVWHLRETSGGTGAIKDSTSNDNAGTDYGSPTFNAAGSINSAISFDGVDDFINMSNTASLQFISSLTIEAWVNLNSFGAGSDVDVILRKGEGNPNDYQLAIHDQRLELMIEENDGAGLDSSTTLSATTWYYVAGTWNGSIRKVYLNGSESASGSKTGSIIPDTRAIYIGGRSGTDLSNGILDEIRASNTTRSAAWVKASYETERDNLLDFGSEELCSYYPANYSVVAGNWVSGTIPTSVQTVDSNYFVVGSAGSATSTTAYNPSGYNLLGSTTLVSGTMSDLVSNNGAYMTFRSYANASVNLQYYNSSDGQSATTSTTYTDKVILTFTPSLSGSYLIIASAGLSGSSTAYDIRIRMTIDGTTYANPTWQPDEANMWESFFTSKMINFTSSSHTIRVQYSSENSGQTVTIRRARIMALKLLNFESNEVDSEQAVTSGTYVDIVTKTFTPSTAGVYLIVATAEVEAASTTNSISTRLQIDGVAKDEMITEGETTTDYEVFAAHNVTTLSAASHTITIQANRETSGTMYIRWARITAVRLSDYYDYQTAGSEGASSTTSTTWVDKTTLTFTPSATGNYLIMATAKINLAVATNGYQPAINFTLDGTEYGFWQAGLSDATDYLTFAVMMNASLSATSHTIKIAYRTTSTSYAAYIKDARIVAVRQAKQYISEVEFTGASNTYSWTQLVASLDSSWSVGYVSVYIQVYDYQNSQYPSSGQAYDAYTSSGNPNTDETRTLTITSNPAYFRNSTGNWKIKIKGAKFTSAQFDFKADWIEFKPTYYSEYTVSTEFLFSSMTKNTPTQLNFTVVSQYNAASVSVTIQVWNYSSSPQAYVTSGEGYLTYTSSGSNETKLLSINTNPQFYTSNGNAKIKITGVKTTSSQFQQETNQVKLLYKYSSAPTYDYVLRIVNQVTDAWKIRLKAYTQNNIGRLINCTINFHNSTDGNSQQIIITNGIYTQQTGAWYDLKSLATVYVSMNLQASDSQVSDIFVYLEILTPNRTTYAQYVLTFEIT